MRPGKIPTKRQFKESFGIGNYSIRRSLPAGSMHRISKLLELHDKSVIARDSQARILILFDLEKHCDYALRHPNQSGIADKQKRKDAVKALQHALRGELCARTKTRHFSEAKREIDRRYGIRAHNHHADQDEHNDALYLSAVERQQYLLHFINGYVCKTSEDPEVDGSVCYDTDGEAAIPVHPNMRGDVLEHNGAMFVLSSDYKLYVTGRGMELMGKGPWCHAGFMAGRSVLAAGTLRCEQGILQWISAKSGHYQPTARNMLTMLEFLRAKHIDLRDVKFYRVKQNPGPIDSPGKGEFDECNAMDFLNKRGFPGPNPNSMFV